MTVFHASERVGLAYGAEGEVSNPPHPTWTTVEPCAPPGTQAGWMEATEGPQKGWNGEGVVTGVTAAVPSC